MARAGGSGRAFLSVDADRRARKSDQQAKCVGHARDGVRAPDSAGRCGTIHYRLKMPADAGEHIQLEAKVNYRKFSWFNTQFSFAGQHDPHEPVPAGAIAPNYDDSH